MSKPADERTGPAAARPDYRAMTLNERLFVAGVLGDFDIAVQARDRQAMIRLLQSVDVDDPGIAADAILDGG